MCAEINEGALEGFQLEPRVWDLVQSHCPLEEAAEVRRILGSSLVEQSLDLYEEASALLVIWRQVREETDSELLRASVPGSLPEPPAVRERLLQEVLFFVDYLQQKGAGLEVSSGSGLTSHDCAVISYISRNKSASGRRSVERPRSAVTSLDGCDTPLRHTPSSEEGSQCSVLSDCVEAVAVNATDIDVIVAHLREELEEECARRRADIAFLQQCLDGEAGFRDESLAATSTPKPSLQDLRSLGSKLEQHILSTARPQAPATRTPPGAGSKPRLPAVPAPPTPPMNSGQSQRNVVARASRVKRPTVPPPLPLRSQQPTSSRTCNQELSTGYTHCPHQQQQQQQLLKGQASLPSGCEHGAGCLSSQPEDKGSAQDLKAGRLQQRAEQCHSYSKPIT